MMSTPIKIMVVSAIGTNIFNAANKNSFIIIFISFRFLFCNLIQYKAIMYETLYKSVPGLRTIILLPVYLCKTSIKEVNFLISWLYVSSVSLLHIGYGLSP